MASITQPNIPPFRADGLAVEEPLAPETIAARNQVRAQAIEDIRLLIQETVGNFDDWEINGGPDTVRELNGNLIIKTTPDYHRQAALILEQISETFAEQISVETRLLMIPTDALIGTGLMKNLTPLQAQAPEEARTAWRFLTDSETSLLVKTALAHRKAVSVIMPRLTVFSGQTGYVTNARQRAYIQDAEPVPGEDGFDITVAQVQDELTVIAGATLVRDRDDIAFEIDGRMILVDENFEERPVPGLQDHPRREELIEGIRVNGGDGNDGKIIIQTPRVKAWRARLKTTMPNKGTLMIVGPELTGPLAFSGDKNNNPDIGPRTPVLIIKPTRIVPQPAPSFGEFPAVELPTH